MNGSKKKQISIFPLQVCMGEGMSIWKLYALELGVHISTLDLSYANMRDKILHAEYSNCITSLLTCETLIILYVPIKTVRFRCSYFGSEVLSMF
jgi:hypothetical protein